MTARAGLLFLVGFTMAVSAGPVEGALPNDQPEEAAPAWIVGDRLSHVWGRFWYKCTRQARPAASR